MFRMISGDINILGAHLESAFEPVPFAARLAKVLPVAFAWVVVVVVVRLVETKATREQLPGRCGRQKL